LHISLAQAACAWQSVAMKTFGIFKNVSQLSSCNYVLTVHGINYLLSNKAWNQVLNKIAGRCGYTHEWMDGKGRIYYGVEM
jgi:hypothetical protein